MLNKDVAQKVLECTMKTGGDFAEIFLEDRLNNTVTLRSSVCDLSLSDRLHGAGIRVYQGLKSYYVYTNNTSEAGLMECANRVASFINNDEKYQLAKLNELKRYKHYDIEIMPNVNEAKVKVDLLKNIDRIAREESEIFQVAISYGDSIQNVYIANSEGRFVSDTRVYSRMRCTVVAGDSSNSQTANLGPGAQRGFEMFRDMDIEKEIKEVAQSAVTMLHAPYCPAGKMPVIIGNAFGGVIFHEACGHSLEATSVALNNSEFSGKFGIKIAADCVTAYDDGTIPNAWGSLNIDDEGTPTSKIKLIDKGILTSYMIDRLNSRRMNMPMTGSARRQSYKFEPTSRMFNTYIDNGNDDEEEIISSTAYGLYAKAMNGGQVNPATGEFNFGVQEAYLIKNGKIENPVRGATLIGKGGQVLMQIDRVGKNLKQAQGMCGSISGSVPTNVGQPLIRVSEMTVGGISE